MASIADLIIRISADLKQYEKSLTKMGVDFERAGKKMTDTGKALTKGLTVPILGAAVAAVKLASDLEESVNKVDVAFGDSAREVHKWSETTLKSFGIAKGTALDMAATFGDMGTAMGQLPSTAADMSTALTGLAGDLASFKNIGIDQAMTALKGVYTGEGEALKTLGIVMQDNTLIAYAQAKGYEKQYKEMTQAEKVALRYAYVMDATKNAQGDFARTSDGVANQTRIVTESLKQAAASLGTQLLPQVAKVLQGINGLIERFASMDDETKRNILSYGLLAASIGPMVLVIGKLSTAFGLMAAKVVATRAVIAGGGGLTGALGALIGPQGIAVLAIAAIAAAGIAIYNMGRDARAATADVKEFVSSLESSAEVYDKQISGIDESVAASQKLVEKLFALADIENKTNAQKREMVDIVAELNKEMPNLSLSINEQTGEINKSEKAVLDYIDALKEQLRFEATRERLTQLYKENSTITTELARAQEKLNDAQDYYDKNVGKRAAMMGQMSPLQQKASAELVESQKQHDLLSEALDKNNGSIKAIEATLDGYYETLTKGNDEITDSTEEMADAVKFEHESLAGMYKDYFSAIEDAKQKHISDMGALDDEGIQKTELTAAKIRKNLEKQIEDFRNWRASIADLASRVPDDVMQELYELGPSFAQVIAELNGMTQEKLNEWVAVWREKSKLATDAARKEVGGLTDWMRKAGWESGNAFAIGLANAIDEIKAAAKRATRAGSIGPVTYSTSSLGKLSTTVGMKAYAHGTDYVPETGPAILHKGEAVLTASENRTRGGITININGPISSQDDVDRYTDGMVRKLRAAGVSV